MFQDPQIMTPESTDREVIPFVVPSFRDMTNTHVDAQATLKKA